MFLARSNAPSSESSTLMIDTPEPIFINRQGSCGVGILSKVTPYFGGSGLVRSSGGRGGSGSAAAHNRVAAAQSAAKVDYGRPRRERQATTPRYKHKSPGHAWRRCLCPDVSNPFPVSRSGLTYSASVSLPVDAPGSFTGCSRMSPTSTCLLSSTQRDSCGKHLGHYAQSWWKGNLRHGF